MITTIFFFVITTCPLLHFTKRKVKWNNRKFVQLCCQHFFCKLTDNFFYSVTDFISSHSSSCVQYEDNKKLEIQLTVATFRQLSIGFFGRMTNPWKGRPLYSVWDCADFVWIGKFSQQWVVFPVFWLIIFILAHNNWIRQLQLLSFCSSVKIIFNSHCMHPVTFKFKKSLENYKFMYFKNHWLMIFHSWC